MIETQIQPHVSQYPPFFVVFKSILEFFFFTAPPVAVFKVIDAEPTQPRSRQEHPEKKQFYHSYLLVIAGGGVEPASAKPVETCCFAVAPRSPLRKTTSPDFPKIDNISCSLKTQFGYVLGMSRKTYPNPSSPSDETRVQPSGTTAGYDRDCNC